VITLLDTVAVFIMPLLLGLASVWCFKKATKLGAAIAMWFAIVSCYLFRWTQAEWSILEGNAKSTEAFVFCLKSAFGQLVSPTTALQWLPLAVTGIVMTHGIILFVADRKTGKDQQEGLLLGRGSKLFQRSIFAAFLVICIGLMARLLWTSIYFTDRYSTTQHAAFVLTPALALATIWWLGSMRRDACDDSKLGTITLATITLSICVLLGTSGSIQYAMFTAGTMTFPFILLLHSRSHCELVRPLAGIVPFTVGLPVVLGYYFAEVTWFSGLQAFLSLAMLMVLWPTRDSTQSRRWAMTLLPVLPVLVASVIGAVGMMNEIQMTPDDGASGYSDR